jgi:peroxiredoxin
MLAAGDHAPDFVLPLLDGGTVSLRDLAASEPVLLVFFKGGCPTCQYTLPFLDRLTAAPELRLLGISQDGAEATRSFSRSFDVSFPVALDESASNYRASNAYKITHVPSLFLVEGTIINQAVSGFSRADLQEIGARFGTPVFRSGEKTPDFRPG